MNIKKENRGGKRAGAGKPKGVKNLKSRNLQILLDQDVSFPKIVKQLQNQALDGCFKSQQLLLAYGFGKPVELQIVQTQDADKTIKGAWLVKDGDGKVGYIDNNHNGGSKEIEDAEIIEE